MLQQKLPVRDSYRQHIISDILFLFQSQAALTKLQ